MKKMRVKILIVLIFVLSINKYSLNIFADTTNNNTFFALLSDNNQNTQPNESNSTILDGEIGEWDPTIDDNPDFENNDDVKEFEGNIPAENDYYTISVTVPLNMDFMVIPNGQLAFGSFFSPIYNIKNNGSKSISVKIKSFEPQNTIDDDDTTPLYISKLNPGDGKTQMELKLGILDDKYSREFTKEIDLTKLPNLLYPENELFKLQANEVKSFKFAADRWEVPKYESHKESAKTNFNASFEFSAVKSDTNIEVQN